ncbi:helix-turn-helix transcriptional regulator [Streptomyces boluensis]|uniref:LuxR family transcriptional regulator n=1 Tax=Streptomyces boluensis TaxID=1775135 RepID=A0A964XMS7_9ACTN|nr:LuxR C-terminal-related transcriptional regulator [Streptomyces boluensis]NBE54700.1 LuxR family transcriptional regulator [Streptomyces boluensis]
MAVTSFVGRDAELAEVGDTMAHARLVTLVGPGGIGKTRLAERIADRVAKRFDDGACVVELSGLVEEELLPHSVATALGLRDGEARSAADAVVGHLRERQLLLVLDTCERVTESCAAFVARLLSEAPRVRILATSRQPVNVPGERTYVVPPLSAADALELFAQRAADAAKGFVVDDSNRERVAGLCRRLDGMPLALELAAVRLRALPLDTLDRQLARRFRLLDVHPLGVEPRHQTLHASLDWSHELCTPLEQHLWARLSRFAGVFGLDAAVRVCADAEMSEDEVVEALVGLVERSVVQYADASAGGWYRMLDTLREFGSERLRERGEEQRLRTAHFQHYARVAADFDRTFTAPGQAGRLVALRRQHADIRCALENALADGHLDEADRLVHGLWMYWHINGLYTEGRYWCAALAAHSAVTPVRRGAALGLDGYLASIQGDPAGLRLTREGLALAGQVEDPLVAGRARLFFQLAAAVSGLFDESDKAAVEGEDLLLTARDASGLHLLRMQDALNHFIAQDLDTALSRGENGLRAMGSCAPDEEGWHHAAFSYALALCHFVRGDLAASAARSRAALRVEQRSDDVTGAAHNLELMAWVSAAAKRFDDAAWLLGAADSLWERMGGRLTGNDVLERVHQDSERATRAALGDGPFDARWQDGRALSLKDAVERATREEPPQSAARVLTPREREVAELAVSGLSNREISERLVVSKRTIDVHMEHIFTKLGITSRRRIAPHLDMGTGTGT